MNDTVTQTAKDEDDAKSSRGLDIHHPKTIYDGKAIVPFVRRFCAEPAWALPGCQFTTDEATARTVAANMNLLMQP